MTQVPRWKDEPAVRDQEWSRWHPVGAAAMAALTAAAVALQGDLLLSPRRELVFVTAALTPWLLDALLTLRRNRTVPIWVFAPVVLGSVAALVASATRADLAPFFLVLLTMEVAVRCDLRVSLAVAAGSAAVMGAVALAGPFDDGLSWIFGITVAWAGTFATTTERRTRHRSVAARAATEERQRIAREIHDVIAHSLSVTMLHVTGARLSLRRDPEEAEAALREAERLGRESLADVRLTVGLLAPGGTGTEPPMPTASDLLGLVESFRAAGVDVTLDVTGDPVALPAATGLVLYRTTQESLANVAKHAPGASAAVRVDVTDDVTRVTVRNRRGDGSAAAPSPGSGFGLRGLHERATLVGGRLRAGPDGSEWVVEVEVPRTPERL